MPQLATRFTLLAATLLIAIAAPAANAQQTTTGTALPSGAIPTPAGTDTAITDPARLRAASELLEAVGGEAQFAQTQALMIEAMTQSEPMSLMRDVIQDWSHTYMTWEALRPEMLQLYARSFSTEDMVQTTSFLRTPAGRHFTAKTGSLMSEGAKIGQRIARQHMAELQAAIQKRITELQAQRAQPAPPAPQKQ